MGLDTVELVLSFEEAFGIEFSDADAELLTTPAKLIDCVMKKLAEKGELPRRDAVALIVRMRTIEQLGISPERYWEDARFVEDFGAD